MRVVVVGTDGPVGRAILETLADDKWISHVVSLRRPRGAVSWRDSLDIEQPEVELTDDLAEWFRFADAVIYAGWPISCFGDSSQADHLPMLENVCRGIVAADVHTFIYGSSVGVYSPAYGADAVGEDWATSGLRYSRLSQQMAQNEQFVEQFAASHPIVRVVSLRAAVTIAPSEPPSPFERWGLAALGRKLVSAITTGAHIRLVPDTGQRLFQIVHERDLANAFCKALTGSVVGAFNIASEPFSSDLVVQSFDARGVPVSPSLCSQIFSLSRRLGLHSLDSGWLDIALKSPVLNTTRAAEELGWNSQYSAASVLEDLARTLTCDSTKSKSRKEAALVSQPS